MTLFKRLVLSTILILSFQQTKASHLFGGEIYWECTANGKYIFHLDIYRECSGTQFFPTYTQGATIQLDVLGSPKPLDNNNQNINFIPVIADWNRFVGLNQGDISTTCYDSSNFSISCSNGDFGALQVLPFVSDTITLIGTPPVTGWIFKWDGFSRPITANFPSTSLVLRSTMFPITNQNGNPSYFPADSCLDNSPHFAETPSINICRGQEFTISSTAYDLNGDSLSYSWDWPVDLSFRRIFYNNGYSYYWPFPGPNLDPRNKYSVLDSKTGLFTQTVYSGSGIIAYTAVLRVDAFRNQQKISSIWRDIPYYIRDCDPINTQTGEKNKKPTILINGQALSQKNIEVFAGDSVNLDIQVIDSNNFVQNQQNLYLELQSDIFSDDYSPGQNCGLNGNINCASVNPTPLLYLFQTDTIEAIKGFSPQARISWLADCRKVNYTYQILIKASDNACPFNTVEFARINIRVKEKSILENPIIKGASVDFDGRINLQWVPPIDSTNAFYRYDIEAAIPNDGIVPSNFLALSNSVNNYKQDYDFPFLNLVPNLWSTIPTNKDYYFRMKSISGCFYYLQSSPSQAVRVIELVATPAGAPNQSGDIQLNWNAAKPLGSQTKDYFDYESPTWYYVWQNNDANSDLTQTNNWYLREGATRDRFRPLKANVCSPLVALRVEARDTVITLKKGFGLLNPEYDTLVFSTFGIIDVVPMQLDTAAVIDVPLDYLKADIDGANFYQWIDCNKNQAIPNTNNQQYIPQDTGRFKVVVGTGNCQDTSACFYNDKTLDNGVTQLSNEKLQSNAAGRKYQWIDCRVDTLIPGATSRSYSPIDTGYYAVIVSAYGYSDTSNCIPVLAIGLDELLLESQIQVFPNPSKGSIQIYSEKEVINSIKIHGINGALVYQKQGLFNKNVELNLGLETGFYLLEAQLESGERILKKLIIQ